MQSDGWKVEASGVFLTLLFTLMVVVFIMFVGYSAGLESMEAKAVVAGHAEYVPDAAGKPKWQWKDLKGK